MKVTSEGHKQPIIDTFLQAGKELGYKVGDFNGAVQEDIFTSAHTTTHRGFRSVCLALAIIAHFSSGLALTRRLPSGSRGKI